jgi:hypothetical protein
MSRYDPRLLRLVLDHRSLRPALHDKSVFVQGEWEGAYTCESVKVELEKLFRRFSGLQSIKVLPSQKAAHPLHAASNRAFVNFDEAEDGKLNLQ